MISISSKLKDKLIDLDKSLHELGKNLYGRKLFKEYEEESHFYNFHLELYNDGSFTLYFTHSILGHIEKKDFGTQEEDVLYELEMMIALVKSKLKLVSN